MLESRWGGKESKKTSQPSMYIGMDGRVGKPRKKHKLGERPDHWHSSRAGGGGGGRKCLPVRALTSSSGKRSRQGAKHRSVKKKNTTTLRRGNLKKKRVLFGDVPKTDLKVPLYMATTKRQSRSMEEPLRGSEKGGWWMFLPHREK